ncbi:hypothetical protein NC797_17340 [Aquibacillus sp. 3ASR75-11]|uniref:Uncharacterized protein n=1 Tax=Terrihalobacillus insolitus TaxID=2950438 RepID=A0A9X3WY10_9BACI|nr:hypothetical protein [Terrihalobacillus insolitus]MDC3413277.1 hypothetical protein [Terrihalobacillus insolitus]MDC3426261.1 hypothetical protein [Terrihalobacillus insolitus]
MSLRNIHSQCSNCVGRCVAIRTRNGRIHRGFVTHVNRTHVFVRPIRKAPIGGYSYGFGGLGHGFGGLGHGFGGLGHGFGGLGHGGFGPHGGFGGHGFGGPGHGFGHHGGFGGLGHGFGWAIALATIAGLAFSPHHW